MLSDAIFVEVDSDIACRCDVFTVQELVDV